MANPDTSVSSIYAGIGCGIVIIMIYMCIFIFNTSSISTTTLTLIIIPVVAFILSAITNFTLQALKCNDIDSKKALLGSLPSIGTTLIGMLIAYFDKCRIPIVSIIAPYYETNFTDTNTNATTPVKNKNSMLTISKCCSPTLLLETIETQNPEIRGAANSFYIFFGMLFGTAIGSSIATNC
jgi:phosphate/sulfate permease